MQSLVMNQIRQEQRLPLSFQWVEEDKETVCDAKRERTEPKIQQGSVLSLNHFTKG
jgi:hypothetical protein